MKTGRTTNILFIWRVPDPLRRFLRQHLSHRPSVRMLFPETAQERELLELAPEAHAIVGWAPTTPLLEAAENMRLFINPAAGVEDVIDLFRKHRARRSFTLVNGHGNSYLAAQHAVSLLLALNNKLIPHHNWMAQGRWRSGDREGASIPLRDRTVGLLGYGAINRKVHRFLAGFDLDFAVLRRSDREVSSVAGMGWGSEAPRSGPSRFAPRQLEAFLEEVDILMIAVPTTPDTAGMIGLEQLRRLGPMGLLVNIARSTIIQEDALYRALDQSLIAGAAIDVWFNENPTADDRGRRFPYQRPFHRLPNILLSPHRGASPLDDLPRWKEVADNIARLAEGRTDFLNQVDLEAGY